MPVSQNDDSRDVPVLEFRKVDFSWPDGKGLSDVSFSISVGEFALISGPSGSGKSTLLRLAVRLEEIDSGLILLEGEDVESIYPPLMRTRVGFVQQTPTILPGSVRDNLLMPFKLKIRKDIPEPDDSVLVRWLDRLALDDISLDADAASLSVGQKQRLCLIRSVLPKPAVICFDEPTSSLDMESRERVEEVAEELAGEGTGILMVNHTSYRPGCPHIHFKVSAGRVEVG